MSGPLHERLCLETQKENVHWALWAVEEVISLAPSSQLAIYDKANEGGLEKVAMLSLDSGSDLRTYKILMHDIMS